MSKPLGFPSAAFLKSVEKTIALQKKLQADLNKLKPVIAQAAKLQATADAINKNLASIKKFL